MGENEIETSLRSFREVKGYRIRARDGKLGQIEDMLVDDDDWQIVYLIIPLPWIMRRYCGSITTSYLRNRNDFPVTQPDPRLQLKNVE